MNYLITLVIAASALGATYWRAYKQGEKSVQAEWDAQTVETLKLARQRDDALRITKEKALEDQKQSLVKNAAAADRARIAAERLRGASEQSLAAANQSHAACVVSASTHAKLFNNCQREYRDMAKNADGHAADAKALTDAWPK